MSGPPLTEEEWQAITPILLRRAAEIDLDVDAAYESEGLNRYQRYLGQRGEGDAEEVTEVNSQTQEEST